MVEVGCRFSGSGSWISKLREMSLGLESWGVYRDILVGVWFREIFGSCSDFGEGCRAGVEEMGFEEVGLRV